LFRTAVTNPRFSTLSIASRTGVAETSNWAANTGTEKTSPGIICPEMIAAAIAFSTFSRKLTLCSTGVIPEI
jgi:hypothetical protein